MMTSDDVGMNYFLITDKLTLNANVRSCINNSEMLARSWDSRTQHTEYEESVKNGYTVHYTVTSMQSSDVQLKLKLIYPLY